MLKNNWSLPKYAVPIIALFVVAIHFMLASTTNLSKWKGGGFGMYAEMHYYYYDIFVDHINKPLDSLIIKNKDIARFVKVVKRSPNASNLKHLAELVSKYATNDTFKIQIWKPLIDSKNSTFSRELINEYQFIKQ